jgi:hypothetical protein
MIGYHVDRSGLLEKNQILDLYINCKLGNLYDNNFNNSLSSQGLYYLSRDFLSLEPNSFVWEIALEHIRALHYSHLPSRFQCAFAVENLEEAKKWSDILHKRFTKKNNNTKIVKLEIDKYFKADAGWFTQRSDIQVFEFENGFDNNCFAAHCYFAHKYWSGETSPHPAFELLVQLPCKVIEVMK